MQLLIVFFFFKNPLYLQKFLLFNETNDNDIFINKLLNFVSSNCWHLKVYFWPSCKQFLIILLMVFESIISWNHTEKLMKMFILHDNFILSWTIITNWFFTLRTTNFEADQFFFSYPSPISVTHMAVQTFIVQLNRFINASFLLLFLPFACWIIMTYLAYDKYHYGVNFGIDAFLGVALEHISLLYSAWS